MGLAAVPFGTAQVHGEGYQTEIKVKRIEEEGSWRVDIEVKNFCSTELLRERSVSCSWDRNLLFSAMREGVSTCRFPVVRVTLMGEWDVYRKNRHLDGNVEVKKGGMHVASFALRSDLCCYLCFLPEGVDNEKFYEVAFLVSGRVKPEDTLIVSSEGVPVFDFCRYFLAPGGKKSRHTMGLFSTRKYLIL